VECVWGRPMLLLKRQCLHSEQLQNLLRCARSLPFQQGHQTFGVWQRKGAKAPATTRFHRQHPRQAATLLHLLRPLLVQLGSYNSALSPNAHTAQSEVAFSALAAGFPVPFPFTCVTVNKKPGRTFVVHIDKDNSRDFLQWVVPLGTWTGGDLSFPYLGVRLNLCQGDLVGFRAEQVFHCVEPCVGERITLSFFTDRNTQTWALEKGKGKTAPSSSDHTTHKQ
jgi:hypothetical protein